MELRQLECFVAVAEERNFTRAAARLYLAQSGLSATIKTLEAELHAPLFERTTRRVELTAAGDALLPEARRTLAAARAAAESVSAVQGLERGTVTVGIMQHSELVSLPATLARFHGRYPGVELHLRQAPAAELIRFVHDGIVDLAVTTPSERPDPGLVVVELFRSPLVLACRPDDPLANRAQVTPRALRSRNLVSFPTGWAVRALADRVLQEAAIATDRRLEVNDTATLLELVHAGLGVALVPAALAAEQPGLHTVALSARPADWVKSAVALAPAPTNPAALELWHSLVNT
jgi:DNA-binding transcriptional LysR family regulator